MADGPSRIQFVISGKFIVLFLLALALLGAGYRWHTRQQVAEQHAVEIQEHFKAPPYFVNRGASVVRGCFRCLALGKLNPQLEWKVGTPTEIPDTEHRWFLAVEDPPVPVAVSGVLMLPVFPALHDNPAMGFNQSRVELVLFQSLERKFAIEQPPPPPPPAPPPSTDASPVPTTEPPQPATAPTNPDGKQ
jgi:hypothetical protein